MSGYTKRAIINLALEKIGIASYDFDIQPEQYESLLKELDLYVASLYADGVRVGYNFASNPNNSDLDGESGIPRGNVLGVALNFAILIAGNFGKTVGKDLQNAANDAKSAMSEKSTSLSSLKRITRPTYGGAGNRCHSTVVQQAPDDVLSFDKTSVPFIPE